MIKVLQKYYDWFINIGVKPELLFEDKLKVQLTNQLLFIVIFFASIYFVVNQLSYSVLLGNLIVFIWLGFSFLILHLNKIGAFKSARGLLIFVPLIMVSFLHHTYGFFLGIESIYLLIVALYFFFFEGIRFRIGLAVLLALYLILSYYNLLYPDLTYKTENVSTARTFYFIATVFILILMTRKYIDATIAYDTQINNKYSDLKENEIDLKNFTYIASHDLRSPLRNVLSFAEIMDRKLKRDNLEELDIDLAFIRSNAYQMHELIQDLNSLSLTNNGINEQKSWIDLNDVLQNTIGFLHQEIQEKKALIRSSNLPYYYCNPTRFGILFQNLIQNGIKYNKSKKISIHIYAEQNKEGVLLYFKDNGIGVPDEDKAPIFDFFKRSVNSTNIKGTGIGLGICNRIVKAYKGQLTVEDVDPSLGGGSIFIICLPHIEAKII